MEYEYIDAHGHLQFEDYDADRSEEIARMKEAKTAGITVGVDAKSSAAAVALAEQHDHLFACVGVHPTYDDPDRKNIEALAARAKVVGIGECGLDFFRADRAADETRQREVFEWQIELALAHDKPLMIHARDSYKEVAEVLAAKKKEAGEKLRGNMHFFAGTVEEARLFLDLGFTLSFTGVITFARSYDEVIRFAPLSSILSETDAPYVAPAPFRGKRNNPRYVSEVVSQIAKIRNEDEQEVKKELFENTKRLFRLPVDARSNY